MLEEQLEDFLVSRDKSIPADLLYLAAQSESLIVLSLLSQTLHGSMRRIQPEPDHRILFEANIRYYLTCIKTNPDLEDCENRYGACRDLAGFISYLAHDIQFEPLVQKIAREIEQLYVAGDDDLQTALINGFLEHAMEDEKVRPFFDNWKDNPTTLRAYNYAMDWVRTQK